MEIVVIVLFVVLLAPLLLELLVYLNLFIIRFRENWKEEIGCLLYVILITALGIYLLMIA